MFINAVKRSLCIVPAIATEIAFCSICVNGLGAENLEAIGAACKGLSDQQLKLILSTKGLVNGDRELILAGMGVEEQEHPLLQVRQAYLSKGLFCPKIQSNP